jgi:hypothetical protein
VCAQRSVSHGIFCPSPLLSPGDPATNDFLPQTSVAFSNYAVGAEPYLIVGAMAGG